MGNWAIPGGKLLLSHAIAITFALGILLGTVYTQLEPYKFVSSNASIRRALRYNTAQEILNSEDIYDWIHEIMNEVAGQTIDLVNANCAYEEPNTQIIIVDGVSYTIYNPETQYQTCTANAAFMEITEDLPVYLVGNHQLLTFGIFFKRSKEEFADNDLSSNYAPTIFMDKKVMSSVNPRYDRRVIEVCDAPWSTSEKCVLRDGFAVPGSALSPGATLNWYGVKIGNHHAYYHNSTARLHRVDRGFTTLSPCYSYISKPSGRKQLTWGNLSYSADISKPESETCKKNICQQWESSTADLLRFTKRSAEASRSFRR